MSSIIEGRVDQDTLRLDVGVSRLDAASCRGFKKQVDEMWTDGIRRVELNFESVEFIDSSGVGALLGVYKRLPKKDATVRLHRVKAPVQSVIELLRLHRIFEIAN